MSRWPSTCFRAALSAAPGEGLQEHQLLALGHGAGLDLTVLRQRQQRREVTDPQVAVRLEVAEVAAEEQRPVGGCAIAGAAALSDPT